MSGGSSHPETANPACRPLGKHARHLLAAVRVHRQWIRRALPLSLGRGAIRWLCPNEQSHSADWCPQGQVLLFDAAGDPKSQTSRVWSVVDQTEASLKPWSGLERLESNCCCHESNRDNARWFASKTTSERPRLRGAARSAASARPQSGRADVNRIKAPCNCVGLEPTIFESANESLVSPASRLRPPRVLLRRA